MKKITRQIRSLLFGKIAQALLVAVVVGTIASYDYNQTQREFRRRVILYKRLQALRAEKEVLKERAAQVSERLRDVERLSKVAAADVRLNLGMAARRTEGMEFVSAKDQAADFPVPVRAGLAITLRTRTEPLVRVVTRWQQTYPDLDVASWSLRPFEKSDYLQFEGRFVLRQLD